jgi:hypothetical protein
MHGPTRATSGTLKRLTFQKAPTVYGGSFRIVDDSLTSPPRALFCEDVSTSWRTTPNPIYLHVLLEGNFPFGNLTVLDCPGGAEFQVEIG